MLSLNFLYLIIKVGQVYNPATTTTAAMLYLIFSIPLNIIKSSFLPEDVKNLSSRTA